MKLKFLIFSISLAVLAFACTSAPKYPDAPEQRVSRTDISNIQDSDGNITVKNETGHEIIMFINGEPSKRIASAIDKTFKVKITDAMIAANADTTRMAEIKFYPAEVFADTYFTLTEANKNKTVAAKAVDAKSSYEFTVSADKILNAIGNAGYEGAASVEIECTVSRENTNVLVELYSDEALSQRFTIGAITPGQTIRVIKDPEEMTNISIYAKYTRNDGVSRAELASGVVRRQLTIGDQSLIQIQIPSDYRNLPGARLNDIGGTLSPVAKLTIENTRAIDYSQNTDLLVYLGTDSTLIGNHSDVNYTGNASGITAFSTIRANNRKDFLINLPKDGQSYMIYVMDATARPIQVFDVILNFGEQLYITVPGIIPAQITSPNAALTREQLVRRLAFTANEADVEISYEIVSTRFPSSIGEVLLGKTDAASRHALSGQVSPVIEGLSYNDAANVKIVFRAKKDGFIPQSKSLNFQNYLNGIGGITLEPFVMEKRDF
jgi:hypothetical protein